MPELIVGSREFYLQRRAIETPLTLRMLQALPADRLDYKPHERSPSAGQIAWTIVRELQVCSALALGPEVVFPKTEWPEYGHIMREFEVLSQVLTERVTRMTLAEWEQPATVHLGEGIIPPQPIGNFLWMMHFDTIHHRGQLSTYARPMGGRVPSIYGPSADDPGTA